MTPQSERLKKLFSEVFEISENEIIPNAHIFDDLGADSMRALEVVAAVEREFDIEFEDEEMELLTTFAQVLSSIESKLTN